MKLPDNIARVLIKDRRRLNFSGSVEDAVAFGFGYVETEDNYVSSVICNSKVMKKVLVSVGDSVLDDEEKGLGTLWTSRLYLFDRLRDNQIIFANENGSVILDLNIDVNVNGGMEDANI